MTNPSRTIEALLLSTSLVALCGQAMADAPEALTPAQPFVNSLGVRMVWIPPGTYQMGSPGGEAGRNKNEGPVHKVTFVKGFWMSECEITQEQWQRLMATNPSFFKGPKRPVGNVNLMDCHEFSTLLSAREGRDYRLPTESEWEYACRAGSHESRYQKLDDIAWYAANSGRTTHDVGTKLPNAWGLYDMLGNVLEWCEDSFHQDYKGAPADGGNNWNDERGPGKDLNPFCQVLRGGSWEDSEANCRAAARFALAFGVTYPGTVIVPDTFGLRLVCTGESKTRPSSSPTPRMTPRAALTEEERKAQENKDSARVQAQKNCDGGVADGCLRLGVAYDKGDGVPRDKVKAAQLYQKACDGGNATGCYYLARMCANGDGVAQDKEKAAQLYQKACDGGDAGSCTDLGIMYDSVTGVAQYKVKAAQLYQKACDLGNAAGCNNLGVLYDKGIGVAQDKVKAAQLYKKACDGGIAQGCEQTRPPQKH